MTHAIVAELEHMGAELERLTAERDAAQRERDEWFADMNRWYVHARKVGARVGRLRALLREHREGRERPGDLTRARTRAAMERQYATEMECALASEREAHMYAVGEGNRLRRERDEARTEARVHWLACRAAAEVANVLVEERDNATAWAVAALTVATTSGWTLYSARASADDEHRRRQAAERERDTATAWAAAAMQRCADLEVLVRRVFAQAKWVSFTPDQEYEPSEEAAQRSAHVALGDYLANADADGSVDADADEVAVCALLTVWRVADDDEGGPPYLERDPDVAALLEEVTRG